MEKDQRDFKRQLGRRIKQIRETKKLAQGELAAMIGKDKQFINRYERDGANPTSYILLQICEALKVTPNELLDFTDIE